MNPTAQKEARALAGDIENNLGGMQSVVRRDPDGKPEGGRHVR